VDALQAEVWKESQGLVLPFLYSDGPIRCWPVVQFPKAFITRQQSMPCARPKAVNQVRPVGGGLSFWLSVARGLSGWNPKVCTVSIAKPVCRRAIEWRQLPGRRACAARAALFWTGTRSCSSLNLPSSKVAGCAPWYRSNPLVSWFCFGSVFVTDRRAIAPQRMVR
jgi:hypothetical protein